ncbi:protein APCDD1-like [Babylonia areolata]|uniref:protein APCDD1-like n=1 Tax=Babylonia areolata TaxID=304850 RepID=UPI003FD29221
MLVMLMVMVMMTTTLGSRDRRMGSHLFLLLFVSVTTCVTCVMTQLPHHVYREDWKERTCSRILQQVLHRHVTVDMPLRLTGQWTSHRCEIRSGPQFVLRSYTFHGLRFESRLYHYEDPDCSKPLYAIVANGIHRLLQESWVIPGVLEATYRLEKAYLVPYRQDIADHLFRHLKDSCGDVLPASPPTLTPFHKYPILSLPRTSGRNHPPPPRPNSRQLREDFDCTQPLNFTLNELQLVRLETRVHHGTVSANGMAARNSGNAWGGARRRVVRELLLGDVHTEPAQRQSHRPTSFQEPLRDAEMSLCGVCSRVSNSDALNPPRLGVHQGTLLSLEGEWVSTRCESRQYGQFLTRWLHFLPDGHSWEGRYDYYHDALCRLPSFTLRAKGSYAGGQESKVIRGSKAYSFKTTRLKVTARDADTVETLNRYHGSGCGQAGRWQRDLEQDVTNTSGCVTLGIRLPSLEQDLLRMEAVHRKLLLYVGQRSTDRPVRDYHHPPPSAFQAPLVKCDAHDLDMSINSLPESKVGHALALTSLKKVEGGSGGGGGGGSGGGGDFGVSAAVAWSRGRLQAVWMLAAVVVVFGDVRV